MAIRRVEKEQLLSVSLNTLRPAQALDSHEAELCAVHVLCLERPAFTLLSLTLVSVGSTSQKNYCMGILITSWALVETMS